ncbi:MAG: low molecular weight phosphotyrosine protein phosphatase [Bifidobacteriaceae bacterium]|jgi:protein-tyrosine phosphatase|nr:low molecular weight phosphotyrosine protein phosphatase [Bifidobacteriaceae bacterium]
MYKVMMVCTGNICRSQMAHMVLQNKLNERGIIDVTVDSAGIYSGAAGYPIDPRAAKVLAKHGYKVFKHYAKQISEQEIEDFDLILAMTSTHYSNLMSKSSGKKDNIRMYMQFSDAHKGEKPSYELNITDPWYGSDMGFQGTLDNIEECIENIIEHIEAEKVVKKALNGN